MCHSTHIFSRHIHLNSNIIISHKCLFIKVSFVSIVHGCNKTIEFVAIYIYIWRKYKHNWKNINGYFFHQYCIALGSGFSLFITNYDSIRERVNNNPAYYRQRGIATV